MIDELPPPFESGAYPWDMWLNGQPWLLIPGRSFDPLKTNTHVIQLSAHKAARRRNVVVKTWLHDLNPYDPSRGRSLAIQAHRSGPIDLLNWTAEDFDDRIGELLDPDEIPLNAHRGKYPWDEWLSGTIRILSRPEHFQVSLDSFRASVHRAAKERDLWVKTRQMGANALRVYSGPEDRNLVTPPRL